MSRFQHPGAADGENAAHQTLERARRHAREGDPGAALPLFREVIRAQDPELRQAAFVGAGNVHLAHRQLDRAAALYERACECDGDLDHWAEALQNLAIVRYLQHDHATACELMQEIVDLDHPELSPLAHDNLGVLFGITLV